MTRFMAAILFSLAAGRAVAEDPPVTAETCKPQPQCRLVFAGDLVPNAPNANIRVQQMPGGIVVQGIQPQDRGSFKIPGIQDFGAASSLPRQ